MSRVNRATIAPEIWDQVRGLVEGADYYREPQDFQLKLLLRSADKLSNADAAMSSIVKALAYHLSGDDASVTHWLANARRFPQLAPGAIDAQESCIWSNLGWFGKAAQATTLRLAEHVGPLDFARMALLCGAFESVAAYLSAGADIAGSEDAFQKVRRCAMVLERVGVPPAGVRSVLDVAGEVLRQHRMFFSGTEPIVHTLDSEDGAGLLYELRVPVDAATADAMTDEVIHALIERELLLPGVSFSFVGTR